MRKWKLLKKERLPTKDRRYSSDCLFCSRVGYCYKKHRMAYDFDCDKCEDFYRKTIK